jgi:hypothetical protein
MFDFDVLLVCSKTPEPYAKAKHLPQVGNLDMARVKKFGDPRAADPEACCETPTSATTLDSELASCEEK